MQLANNYKMLFYETSAKTGLNINEIFNKSVESIAEKINQGYYDLESDSSGIKVGLNNSIKSISIDSDSLEINKKTSNCC